MDSMTNGEVLDECVSNAEESSDMLMAHKKSSETKNLNEAGMVTGNELPISDILTPIDTVNPNRTGTLNDIAENKSIEESKGSGPVSTVESKSDDCVSTENMAIKTKENKTPILDEASGDVKQESSVKTQRKSDSTDWDKASAGTDSLSKTSIQETLSPKDINSVSSLGLIVKETKYVESSASNTNFSDKEAGSSNNALVVLSDKKSELNVSVEIGVDEKANVFKHNFMSGGSIINSDSIQGINQKLDSDKCNNLDGVENKFVSQTSQSFDLSKSDPVTDCMTESVEQPLNFASKKMEELANLSKVKFPHENGFKELNPLQKLNEHLNSIGSEREQIPLYNHTPKGDIPDLINTSLTPIIVSHKSDAHSCNDKDKSLDSSHSHERSKDSPDSFVFSELSNEETGFPEAFTGLVKIGKYISVKGDFTLRSTEALVESPSLVAPYLLKEPDSFPPRDKDSAKQEVKDFFHSAAGEILIGIGLSRVNEWFHRDMVRIKKRQIKKNGKTPQLEEDLGMHEKYFEEAKKANNVYSFSIEVCKTCGFTTESAIVMEGHLLVPHITQRREYQCNFCDVINRDPKVMLEHMETVHRKVGRIQPPVLFFECPYCTFESNSKVKLNNHLTKCQRFFDNAINQAPPKDFELPALTPKPITVAVVKAYEKSLGSMQRGRGRPKKDLADSLHQFPTSTNLTPIAPNPLPTFRASSNSPLADSLSIQNQIMSPIQMPNMSLRPAHANSAGQLRPGIPTLHMPPPNRFFQVVNPSIGQILPVMGNNHLVTSQSQYPFSANLNNAGGKKPPYYNSMFGSGLQQNSSKNMPSVTITPLPKLQGPYPVPTGKPSTASGSSSVQSNSLVVCEICDGYIKDLEQLRTHMQLIHKVKIHPKMLISRPPLNCQKCQWRFFTDQGLERHLLGAHGLVTSNMQELANKGKDAGCCTICGRVYASKLVGHMNQVHRVTLKPAHLSYKCTVCSATFNLYRLFENHVYLVHSGAAKRSADGRSSPSKKLKTFGDSLQSDESLNHKDEKPSQEIGDENVKKCKDCGSDMSHEKKSQSEKCEKCLKPDDLVQGTLSTKTFKDELRKKDKSIEKAAV